MREELLLPPIAKSGPGGKWPVMRPKMNSSFTFRVEANEHKNKQIH